MAKRWRKPAALGLAAIGIAVTATAADHLPALAKLQPGQWQIKELGSTEGGRSVCLADLAKVLQIAHGDNACTRTVIDSDAKKLTVRYSCPGKGQGQSVLSFSTPYSFRLQTQGMSAGSPFDYDYDARRIGDCPGTAPVVAPTPAPTSGAH